MTPDERAALEQLARTLDHIRVHPNLVSACAEQLRNWLAGDIDAEQLRQMAEATRRRGM